MQKPYVVERMDIVSRRKFPKSELLRLVVRDNQLILDREGHAPAKGIYVHKDKDTIARLRKKNILFRYSKTTDYEKLFEEMEHDC